MWEAVQCTARAFAANPAWIAAVAAFFSALTSFFVWRVQKNKFMESIRPQLDPVDWGRETRGAGTEGERASISFRGIANTGRGAAFDAWLRVDPLDTRQRYHMTAVQQVPLIAANGEPKVIPTSIQVWFQNTADPFVTVPLWVSCYDSHRNYHSVLFSLDVFRAHERAVAFSVAPNVFMTRRASRMKSARRMPFGGRVNRYRAKYGWLFKGVSREEG
jgi:hypothetical protein